MELYEELQEQQPLTTVYIVQGGDIRVVWAGGQLSVRGPLDRTAAGFEVYRLLAELMLSQQPSLPNLRDPVDDVDGGTA